MHLLHEEVGSGEQRAAGVESEDGGGRDARSAHPVTAPYHEPDPARIESLRVGSFEDYLGVSDLCLDHHGIGIRWRSERESRVSGRADGEEPRLSPKHRWPGSWEGVELVH